MQPLTLRLALLRQTAFSKPFPVATPTKVADPSKASDETHARTSLPRKNLPILFSDLMSRGFVIHVTPERFSLGICSGHS
jgi:hypothetical protein